MGKILIIKNADFSNVAVHKIIVDDNDSEWLFGIYSKNVKSKHLDSQYFFFSKEWSDKITGKEISQIIIRFGSLDGEYIESVEEMPIEIGYCDFGGENKLTPIYNSNVKSNTIINLPVSIIPIGKRIYFHQGGGSGSARRFSISTPIFDELPTISMITDYKDNANSTNLNTISTNIWIDFR